jgi:two-component system, response regulator PdtaR
MSTAKHRPLHLIKADPLEEYDRKTNEGYIKALMDISQAITSDLFLEDLLKLIVMVTAKVTGVEICSLWLIDEEEKPP